MGFLILLFFDIEDPAAIKLGYTSCYRSTHVVETDKYVEVMDEDVTEPSIGEITVPPREEARAHDLSSDQEEV